MNLPIPGEKERMRMSNERQNIDRVLDAVSMRPTKESARVVCNFFVDCLKQTQNSGFAQIRQELLAPTFVGTIEYLLIMHGVEKGFFRLENDVLQITLRVSYNPMEEEDLSLPTLALSRAVSAESPVTFVIARNQEVSLDESMLEALNRVNQRGNLHVRSEFIGVGVPAIPVPLPDSDLPPTIPVPPPDSNVPPTLPVPQSIVQQVRNVVELLGLSTSYLVKNLQELMDTARLWQEDKSLVAFTLVVKNLRVIVGLKDPNKPLNLETIKFHLERLGATTYTLGVLLIPPSTRRQRWNDDEKGKGYRDFQVGSVPQDELDKAEHKILV